MKLPSAPSISLPRGIKPGSEADKSLSNSIVDADMDDLTARFERLKKNLY